MIRLSPSFSTATRWHRRFFAGGGVLLAALIVLPLLPLPSITSPSWAAFVGRLHPIAVHFPIALIPLLTLFELVVFRKMKADVAMLRTALWGMAILASLFAVAAGYFLLASGDYAGELAREHFWGAIATACLLIVAGVLRIAGWPGSSTVSRRVYTGLLVLINLALVYTGHHGGSLTHGASFLSEALPLDQPDAGLDKPREELLVLDDLVLPALDLRCVSCHNASKTKGDLQLTSYEHLQAGGESGKPLLVAGDPDAGELMRRVTLPPDDDDFMPPEGKTPLQDVEIDLIRWWLLAGADPDMRFGSGPEDSTLALDLERYIPALQRTRLRRIRDRQAFRDLLAAFRRKAFFMGLEVSVDAESDSSLFTVSMQIPPQPVDDNAVAELAEYAPYIGSLSLPASEITDDALYHIQRMTNLRRLFLPNTTIDGAGLVYLRNLSELAVLNLSHTKLTGANALHLAHLPALEEVFIFDTEVDPVVFEALQQHIGPEVIQASEGPFQ